MLILIFCKDRAQIRANLRVRINACISLCKMLNYPVADPSWGWGGGNSPPPLFLDQTEARRSGSGTAIPFYGNKAETIELVFTRRLFTRHKIRSGYTRQRFAATHAAATNHFLFMAPP